MKEELPTGNRNDFVDFDELLIGNKDKMESSVLEGHTQTEQQKDIKSKSIFATLEPRKINAGFLVASILVSFYWNSLQHESSNSLSVYIGAIGGGLIFIYLLPFLIAHLVKFIYKLSKNDFGAYGFVATFAIVWCIIVFLLFQGTYIERQQANAAKVTANTNYLYKPNGSEFSAVFVNNPTISSIAQPFGSYSLKGEVAEFDLLKFRGFERVEFLMLDKKFIPLLTRDYLYNFLNTYNKNNGCSYPIMKFHDNSSDCRGELQANKEILDENGNKRIITFYTKVYIKGETFFIATVCAQAKDFPTPEILRFWSSIK